MALVINSIFFVLCAIVGYLLHDIGFFSKIIVKRDKTPKMTIAGVRFRGPYQNTGKSFQELEKKLTEAKIDVLYCGLYYDDLQKVPADKLRTFIGAIIKNPNEETLSKLKELELEIIEIEEQEEAIHGYHQMSSIKMLQSISFMTAPMRVYPAMTKYIEQNPEITGYVRSDYEGKNLPCYEIYDREAKQIHFILSKSNVKEVLVDFK
ncbi:hypothetical protein BCR36DRAFT_358091 [Piromyces finnis]|uniref:GyrI-like small molecule binding domain-containing protein n=1 Tax=Piromyces finnis TaxID=1754191 RepID=A0A1Y1V298_9FUNG|nr:hypothetical protein BCR36DRAFT_358091 [Piromyces finnis]|eukprot:ORX45575.1 hypothetical protein BCR36DRAFT_358091 [Piromyces finnis]